MAAVMTGEEKKNTPPEAFQMDEKKSSTWSRKERFAVPHHFGFSSGRKGNHLIMGAVNVSMVPG